MEEVFEKRLKAFGYTELHRTVNKRQEFRCKLREKLTNEHKMRFRLNSLPKPSSQTLISDSEQLIQDLTSLSSMSEQDQLFTIHCIRNIISNPNSPTSVLINHGLIEILYPCLQISNSEFTKNILWIYSNILASTGEECLVKFESLGLINCFLRYLKDQDAEIVENSLRCISNYIANTEETCFIAIKKGLLSLILHVVKKFSQFELISVAAWALNNIVNYESLLFKRLLNKIFEICEKLLDFCNFSIQSKVLNILSSVIRADNNKIEEFIHNDIFQKCLCCWKTPELQQGLIKILANICGGTHEQTQFLIELKILDLIFPVFDVKNEEIQRVLMFLLSNVAAGTVDQVKILMTHPIFDKCIRGLRCKFESVRIEASFVLRNAVKVMKKQLRKEMFSEQAMEIVFEMRKDEDPVFVGNMMYVAKEFIKLCGKREFCEKGYFEALERFESSKNKETFAKCIAVIAYNTR